MSYLSVPLIENVKMSVISAVNFGNLMSRFVKDASKISVPDVPKDFYQPKSHRQGSLAMITVLF